MKIYELIYIVSSDISLEDAQGHAKEIQALIQGNDGLILQQSPPVAKTLAYPIKKHASGFAGLLEFQIEPEKLNEVEGAIRRNTKIIRHMILIKKPFVIKKEKRTRPEALVGAMEHDNKEIEKQETTTTPTKVKAVEPKGKVELKDIEDELEKILGE